MDELVRILATASNVRQSCGSLTAVTICPIRRKAATERQQQCIDGINDIIVVNIFLVLLIADLEKKRKK